ncbi:SDR family NAD(P)-dependent oxidoreductase [Sphingobacterium sp. SG20118]|uniref:SDR family NAD(P)-dependent oxidoreductase n=1 Tax=Sphingobacterium sp. SG20118 TaxID=3367156 RepID=UPI0037DFC4B0
MTFPTCSLYHATKFAIEGFTESLSYELISENIEVKIIEPGATDTSFVGSANMGGNDSITNYQKFDKIALETYGKLNEKSQSTSDEIAEVILEAANDKSGRLRYIIGEDTKRLLKARNTMTDQEYVDYMRGTYIPEFWDKKINTSI